ncbi:hypothetical protein [Streptomyces sp. bgisy100]|uniref:hypothetical protein n=1 Tax=Streptomyces sp. bgisy100 TaxID=3413783 RepID=UPI003D756B86
MEAVAASVIAVLGTLLGSGITHVFQRRASDRNEQFARDERRRQEMLDACSAYAGLLVNYRRTLIHRWFFAHEGRTDENETEIRTRSYDLRSQAQEAFFRIQMLSDDDTLVALAGEALDAASVVHKAVGRPDMDTRRDISRDAIHAFVTAAGGRIR